MLGNDDMEKKLRAISDTVQEEVDGHYGKQTITSIVRLDICVETVMSCVVEKEKREGL